MKIISTVTSGAKCIANGFALALTLVLTGNSSAIAEIGVTPDKIVIGGVMDLEGRSRVRGRGIRDGINEAFKGQKVKGRSIEFDTLKD